MRTAAVVMISLAVCYQHHLLSCWACAWGLQLLKFWIMPCSACAHVGSGQQLCNRAAPVQVKGVWQPLQLQHQCGSAE